MAAEQQDMARIRDAQIDRLISLGFNRRLRLSPAEYRSRFPEVTPKPEGYAGRFDIFLMVEADPSVDLKFQHQALGIVEFVDSEKLITKGYHPGSPYCIWTHDGKRYSTRSIAGALSSFPEDEVPCSQLEVTSLFTHFPGLFKGFGIDSGRTYQKADYYSTLLWVQEHPELALHHLNDFTPGLSVLSRGKLEGE
jgi:hypothetical protein